MIFSKKIKTFKLECNKYKLKSSLRRKWQMIPQNLTRWLLKNAQKLVYRKEEDF